MDIEKTIRALEKNRFTVSCFDSGEAAAAYLDREIDGKTVAFGDSMTLKDLGLYERLRQHNQVFDPLNPAPGQTFMETARACLDTDVFLTSVNAISEKGELVNIDGSGNRVAGALFGHQKIYFVIGQNKITPTLEKAIWRAQNIAAPRNAKRLRLNTPCALQGDKCYDCNSPDRICNGLVVHYKKMWDCDDMEVILIKESLGY